VDNKLVIEVFTHVAMFGVRALKVGDRGVSVAAAGKALG
jgi:hypothetical protein